MQRASWSGVGEGWSSEGGGWEIEKRVLLRGNPSAEGRRKNLKMI
jgi:hypothetical protein